MESIRGAQDRRIDKAISKGYNQFDLSMSQGALYMNDYKFMPADILLPKKGFEKWAVIACDQFTSDKEYWDELTTFVGDAPSALKITLPEAYLDGDPSCLIEKVNRNMAEYLESGVLEETKNAMIYVERTQSDGRIRRGVVGKINLNDYDYRQGTDAPIRATERTVAERIPPRVNIRKDAPLELPHVLLLADDPNMEIIEPLSKKTDTMKLAYDFDLSMGGGHIKGWFLNDKDIKDVSSGFDALAKERSDGMVFAVGDGNHSLAAAKECSLLSDCEAAKYALVEVVNLHDPAIEFEPIYRVVFGADPKKVLNDFKSALGKCDNGHRFTCVYKGGEEVVNVPASSKLPVATLDNWLDRYIADNKLKVDYIHGEDTVRDLCKSENTIGFIFDGMKKDELFAAVSADGSLPRKTFSMGHAKDKRYYIEARRIKN